MYKIVKTLISGIFCHSLYRVKYTNLEIVKKTKQCLICPNHSNIFDPTFIYPKVDNMYIMAKSELFKNKLIGGILRHYGAFPVNRQKRDARSLLFAIDLFKKGEDNKLLIFPEGGVLKKEQDIGSKVKNGAVFIAAQMEVPIIPVYITRNPKVFSTVDVVFGQPIYYSKDIVQDKTIVKQSATQLIYKIYALKEEK